MGLAGLFLAGGVSAQQAPPGEAPLRIPIEVSEHAGIARWSAPVQVGVPLPRNAPAAAAAFRVLDETGTEIPADRWVMARWDGPVDRTDLPIRWLGVRFATDLAARASQVVTVVAEPSVLESTAPVATWTADGVMIDTGRLSFRVPSSGTSVIDALRIDMDGLDGAEAELIAADHSGGIVVPSSAGTPGRWETAGVTVLGNGQFAATVRVDLVPSDGPRGPVALTIRAARGSSVARIQVDATDVATEEISLALPIQTLGDPLQLGVRRGLADAPLEGPLPHEGTLVVRPDADGWTGTLGAVEATGLVPWAQMSTLTWSAAIAAPGTNSVNEFRVSGNGVLWANLTSGSAVDVGIEIRRRLAAEQVAEAFAAPVQAAVDPAALWQAEVFGPPHVASALAANAATGTLADAALTAVLRFATSGDQGHLVGATLDPAAPAAGSVLLARLRADAAATVALATAASSVDVTLTPAAQATRAMQAWEITGQRGHLEHARALLRTAIGTAWSSDICGVAANSSIETASLIQTTGTYASTRRDMGELDQAAENAIFGILDRLQTCLPAGPEWRPAWAFGGALFENSPEGQRWLALSASGRNDTRMAQ